MEFPLLGINVPQPPCPALLQLQNPPRWRTCFSVANLDSFTNYIGYYATAAEIEELLQLPVVYHFGRFDNIATRIPLGVMVQQRWTPLPEENCTAAECRRCERGYGGYSFHWVGERWMPVAAMDLTQTLQEAKDEAWKPWPRGIFREPQPALAQAPPFSTSEWDAPRNSWGRWFARHIQMLSLPAFWLHLPLAVGLRCWYSITSVEFRTDSNLCAAIRVSLPPLNAHLLNHDMHIVFCYVRYVSLVVYSLYMHRQVVASPGPNLLTATLAQRDFRPHGKCGQGCASYTSSKKIV